MPYGNILDKQGIPTDKNAYVYRRADKGGRWYLYFYDKESGKRHRFALKSQGGDIPEPTSAGAEKAWMLGVERFIELKGKSDRGESVRGTPVALVGAFSLEFVQLNSNACLGNQMKLDYAANQ